MTEQTEYVDLEACIAWAYGRFKNGYDTPEQAFDRVKRALQSHGWTFGELESGAVFARPPFRETLTGARALPASAPLRETTDA